MPDLDLAAHMFAGRSRDDLAAEWHVHCKQLARLRRQRATVYATPSASLSWREERAAILDTEITAELDIMSEIEGAWNALAKRVRPTDVPQPWTGAIL